MKFPLTFNLYERPSATSTQTTTPNPIKTKTYQESDNKYSHVFDGLAPGKHYLIETKHVCQTIPKYISLDVSDVFDPTLVIDRPVPFCKGNVATVQLLGIPESIFDIRWFKLDENGNKTTTAPYKVGNGFSEPIDKTTTYMGEYRIKPGIGCTNNDWYTKTATVVMPPSDKPTIVNCPSDITVTATVGRCDAVVWWAAPQAIPSCLGEVTSVTTHTPGSVFAVGTTTTITYTFTDASGNTNSCSFTVTVKPNGLKLGTKHRYTDAPNASGNTITQLQPNQQFYYELRYKNEGSEDIKEATFRVKLPDATTVVPSGEAIVTGAGDNTWQKPYPTKSYTAANKTYEFSIGANNSRSTLLKGDPERVIYIPLKVEGDCTTLFSACQNYAPTEYTVSYKGGPDACPLSSITDAGTISATIDTSGCERQEMSCGTGAMTFRAVGGFTTYQWYDANGTLVGTGQQYAPTVAGVYRVVKTISCNGTPLTVTETINYQTVSITTDPIRAQAQNIGVVCSSDGSWTSQFYLCQGGSKQLTVPYQNTPFEWQLFNTACQNQVTDADCRVTSDDCWTTFSTDRAYSFNTAGLYRLKLTNSGCDTSFYFQIITGSLQGTRGEVKHRSDFEMGSVAYNMSASGVNYKIEIYEGSTLKRTINQNTNRFTIDNLTEGTYRFKITSPQIEGCEYEDTVTIEKKTQREFTATFRGFKQGYCNIAQIRLQAKAGAPTYRFYIWTIDGQKQYADELTAIGSPAIAQQTAAQQYADIEYPITRIGEYEFLLGDQQNGAFAVSNKVTIVPPSPHNFTVTATQEITCESSPNSGHINVTFPAGQQNVQRTINLYQLKSDGTRLSATPYRTSAGGLFTGLPAGTYEVEMRSQVGASLCVYVKKPIEIKAPQAPLRAYAGVVADRSCDSENHQYKVAVNNVSGGTTPYRYSFDGENSYVSTPIGYISGNTNIYVKDKNDCRVVIPITVEDTAQPTLRVSPIAYRCDNGYGSVTITVSSSASYTYQYSLDGSASQTLSGDTINRTLAPGVHTLTVYYRPSNTQTTPNVLFNEDFGSSDENACMPSDSTTLVCSSDATNLQDGQYMVTKQVPAKAAWTVPTDPSGGRYLAVAGNGGGNEVAYKKIVSGVGLDTELTISFDAVNLISSSAVAAPRFNIGISRTNGLGMISKSVGAVNSGAGWKNLSATFTPADLAAFTDGKLQIHIIAAGASSHARLGNDYAIDNVKVQQATAYCELKVQELITVQAHKEMRVERYGAVKNVSCIGGSDGVLRIRVINAPSNSVKYAVIPTHTSTLTWTSTTIDAQGVFTVTGLSATQSGSLQVQDANSANCLSTVAYTIGEPSAIQPTVRVIERLTCRANAKIKVWATGGTPGYKYAVVSQTSYTTLSDNPQEIGNLPAGTHTLVVEDANGCRTETTFEIADKEPLVVTAEPKSYCYGVGDEKKVVIEVQSGNGRYSVQRMGGNTYAFNTPIFEYPDALAAGVHTFTITDGFGCVTAVTTEVYAPLALQVSPTTQLYASCGSSTHTFELSVTGGIASMPKDFEYSIDGGATFYPIGSATTQTTAVVTVPGNKSSIVQFVVTYKPDGSECRRDRFVSISYDPPRFTTDTFTVTKAICGNDNGSVVITTDDYYVGTVSHTFEIRDALTNAVVSPTGMAAGNYIAYLEDARGCVVTKAFTIDKVATVSATATVTKQMGCTSAPADLAAITVQLHSGGTAPFRVSLQHTDSGNETSQTVNSYVSVPFTGLGYGNYQITISDANGCEKQLSALINPNSNVMSITYPTPTDCELTTKAIISATSSGTFTATTQAYFAIYRPGITNPPDSSVLPAITTTNADGVTTDLWHL